MSEVPFIESNKEKLLASFAQIIEKTSGTFDIIHDLQYDILYILLKSSPENREKVLEWIGNIIRRNKDRYISLLFLLICCLT
jgi:hypothetical protein